MSKIIGFLGTYSIDICLYAAFAVQNTGKSVCVIDHSDDGVLYDCIPTPDGQLEAVTYHGVDFMRRQPLLKWQNMEYEFVFVQLGARPQELCLALCSKLVLVVDCERRNLDCYNQYMQETRMPMTVLLRGFCPGGISVRMLKDYFARGNCFIEKWMTLPLNEMDEAYRIGLQYEPLSKFAYISAGMEKALVQLLRQLDAGSAARIIRAVKHAKSGRAAFLPSMPSYARKDEKRRLFGAMEYGGYY